MQTMQGIYLSSKRKCLVTVIAVCVSIICLTGYQKDQLIVKQLESFASYFVGDTRPVMTMRSNLTFSANLSTGLVTQETSVKDAEDIFHRYASEIQVTCPESKRLGLAVDGGWNVCLYGPYNIRQPCLVYSFGINNDWSFDDAVVKTFGCTVRAFDPSMSASDHRRGTNIWFYKLGISGSDANNSKGWTLKTLGSLLSLFNETNETINYLKIDVEYSEWSSLESILNTTVLSRVKQFGLETHTNELNKHPSSLEDYIYYTGLLRRLQEAGFYRWYWHYNHFGVFTSKHSQRKLTCCYEMVFINVNLPYY